MIHVCDTIMGSGKSSSAINYMNEHPENKYIYITPYLDEASRIRNNCKHLNFVEPRDDLRKFHFKKTEHMAQLIKDGANITTTHQAFKRYNSDMLEDIRSDGYVLMIDENMDVLEKTQYSRDDIEAALNSGYIEEHNGMYHYTGKHFEGITLRDMIDMLKSRDIFVVHNDDDELITFYYWILPPELITSFREVFVMTYLFEGQCIHHFFQIYNLEYDFIGITKNEYGYHFCHGEGYTPEYVHHIKDMIHIVDVERENNVGRNKTALSIRWFDRSKDNSTIIKNAIYNCINYLWRGVPSSKKMWGSFKTKESSLKGKGYSRSFLIFNAKATNEYRDKDHLVYAANVYMNVSDKELYKSHGVDVNEDLYSLSVMVQWIWRSAIRDGKEIYIYIPSARMRKLLVDWMDSLSGKEES